MRVLCLVEMNRAGLICPLLSGPHRTYRLDTDDGKGHFGQIACRVGDAIKPGDILAKIETDKVMMEYEAIDEGTIASLAMPEGSQDVPVGTVIATVAAASEAVGEPVLETVNAAPAAAPTAVPPPAPVPLADPVPAPPTAAPDNETINATSFAKRIATVRGLSLLGIAGTGARGRIVKADLGLQSLLAALPVAAPAVAAAVAAPVYNPPADVPVDTVKLSTMRKTITCRPTESKQTVPHFYLARAATSTRSIVRRAN